MRKRSTLTFAGCLAMGILAATGTAHANGVAQCFTTGAAGSMGYDYQGGVTAPIDVELGVSDTSADSHHVAVRLITRDTNGDRHNWSWHHWYSGKDTGNTWNTTAQDTDKGIRDLGVQAAVFEGDHLLNSCTEWD
ncbi:hypothetical protein OG381_46860 [Streptomyces sp. NBC_00490]|uniref:hypothetical protein n=1 Tax=Streptomyces sp. NBC_00490 TaxID=2903657 RepID=UPI002E189175